MAWIESHQNLANHPKLFGLMEQLSVSRAAAIGHLHLLWYWCIDYAPDGDLFRYTPLQLARAADWPGDPNDFVKALLAVGLLDETAPNKYAIHDWLHFCGSLMEKRLTRAAAKRTPTGAERAPTYLTNRTVPTEPNPTQPYPPGAEELTASGEPAIPEPAKEPARALVVWFKVLKGVAWDNVKWDRDWMATYLPQAKELLDRCDGKYEIALGCLDHFGQEWNKRGFADWKFEGIIKRAVEWTAKHKKGADDGQSNFARFFDALDRQRASRKSEGLRSAAETVSSLLGATGLGEEGKARAPNGTGHRGNGRTEESVLEKSAD